MTTPRPRTAAAIEAEAAAPLRAALEATLAAIVSMSGYQDRRDHGRPDTYHGSTFHRTDPDGPGDCSICRAEFIARAALSLPEREAE